MAARAITKKLCLKPQALLSVSNRFSVYLGTRSSSTALIPRTAEEWETQQIGWNSQKLQEFALTCNNLILKQVVNNLSLRSVKLDPRYVHVVAIDAVKDACKEVLEKGMEERQRRLLGVAWACLRDFLHTKGLGDCHHRMLLSISQDGSGGEEGNVFGFATASPEKGLTCLRRSVLIKIPGPYELPRQAVKGVVCFTTKDRDAFLLYEPTTGDASPSIATTAAKPHKGKARRQVESIALGYAPKSNTHKVVCLSTNVKRSKRFPPDTVDNMMDGGGELVVVEVLTVRAKTWASGEHEWRRMKGYQPPPTYVWEDKIDIMDGPVYSAGHIYWLFRYGRQSLHVLAFDVETELFKIVPVPQFLNVEFMDSSLCIRLKLMEADGKVAILKSTIDQQRTSSLCICHRVSGSECGEVKWTEEKVSVPYSHVSPDYSVEALTGTGLIFMHSYSLISYYDRNTEELLSFEIPESLRDDHFGWGRMMQLWT